MHAWKARNTAEREAGEAAVEGCVKGAAFRYAELARELELERAARMCEASRQGQSMNAVREANEFAVSALRARVAREQERAKRADDELAELCLVRDEAAVAIADVLATLEAKIERLEAERGLLRSMFDECDATREALAQHAVTASQRANEARAKVEELEREFEQQTRQMAELVGVLTRTTVEQHAIAGALKRGRVLPTMADVDAALVAVSRRVPEHMSSVLWGARDAIAGAVFAGPEAASTL
jgi:chromosome segregation ATPase